MQGGYVEEVLDNLDDDELLAQLGVDVPSAENSLTELKYVKPYAEIRAAEEIATRQKCEDFERFEPIFKAVQHDLGNGLRETIKFRKEAGFAKTDIKQHHFIILGGQTAYITEIGEAIKAPNGEADARLRVIYSNGTESDILLRSLIRAMYKDDTSRLISDVSAGPLFSDAEEDDDLASGTIYVLRSLSDLPIVQENRDVIHKIGVTGGDVKKRISNAKHDPTFLLADVEVVATYKLANINRTKLEKLIHKFFENAKLDIQIPDRGKTVTAQEWFLAPLFVIDDVVEKLRASTLTQYRYDVDTASVVPLK